MESYKKCKILRFYAASHIHAAENARVRPVVAHVPRPYQTPQCYLCLGFVGLEGPASFEGVVAEGVEEVVPLQRFIAL